MAKQGRPTKKVADAETIENFERPDAYTLMVVGEALADFRGATPEDIKKIIKTPDKAVEGLYFQVAEAQVAQLLQAGDTEGAAKAIKEFEQKDAERANSYRCPTNRFKRDQQNGDIPYIGAHAVFGGFRDASKFLFPEFFWAQVKGMTKLPSAKHLRKFVIVRPNHIFFHRPSLNGSGNIIKDADAIEGQQPIGDVRGFAEYEVIRAPFQFQYSISVNPQGPFSKFLGDHKKVLQALYQGADHGLGASRSAGHGTWRILSVQKKSGIFYDG